MQVLKNRKLSFAILLIVFLVIGNLSAQSKIGVQAPPFKSAVFVSPSNTFLSVPDLELDKAPLLMKTPYFSPHWKPKPFNSNLATDVLNVLAIVRPFNYQDMPFFCKIEFQLELAAKFPVKFRLGDVHHVDRLEQKKDWELGN